MTRVVYPIPVVRTDFATVLPSKAHEDDAAFDLRSCRNLEMIVGERRIVPTGLQMAIPEGHAGLILPRSGLAARHGITVLNSPGLIDSGYRGEVGVLLYLAPNYDDLAELANGNRPTRRFRIDKGDRIAQLLIARLPDVQLLTVRSLEVSERGEGGFGSSGVA